MQTEYTFGEAISPSKPRAATKSETDKAKKWYCEAGSCHSGDGRTYHCGVVLCDLKESQCGCSCIEVSNAPYPKGYCGKVSPYKDQLSKPDDSKHWMFSPF